MVLISYKIEINYVRYNLLDFLYMFFIYIICVIVLINRIDVLFKII